MLLRGVGQRKARRGIVVVLVAMCLVVLMGFVAIVVDGGLAQDRRRHVQAAADAAALAAAAELFVQDPTSNGMDVKGDARNSARAICTANGYIDVGGSGANARVSVNIPPTSGPFSGARHYAEVI